MNYLDPELEISDINKLSILALAHVGDSVFELMVRTRLCTAEHSSALDLHRSAIAVVNAVSQSAYAEILVPLLNEDELAVYKRGRNAKVNSVPKNAAVADYHKATGLEALFGWLYLNGRKTRLEELFSKLNIA